MNKYTLGQIVSFKHYGTLHGEIVGIIMGQYNISYCIFNKELIEDAPSLMEPSDLNTFTTYSRVFESNIGARAYWKSEENIIGLHVNPNPLGASCSKCKEFNKYIEIQDYTCWRCTNYPY